MHTIETKQKIRESINQKYLDKEYVNRKNDALRIAMKTPEVREKHRLRMMGDKNPSKRQEVKEKIRQSVLKLYEDPVYREKLRKKINDAIWKPENRKKYLEGYSKRSNTYKYKNTKPELKIQEELKRRKIMFMTDKRLLKQYRVDLFIKPNIVIECDGCYYHACKQCGFIKYNQEAIKTDLRKTKVLEENNYIIYRFWEHEINKSPAECVDKLAKSV